MWSVPGAINGFFVALWVSGSLSDSITKNAVFAAVHALLLGVVFTLDAKSE